MHANSHLEFVNPPPPQTIFPHPQAQIQDPSQTLEGQVIGQEICLNVYTNASFE